MSLPERVADFCKRGLLPARFSFGDVRGTLGDIYSEKYVRRALSLYSQNHKNYTYRWNKPRFRKVRHGIYELAD